MSRTVGDSDALLGSSISALSGRRSIHQTLIVQGLNVDGGDELGRGVGRVSERRR